MSIEITFNHSDPEDNENIKQLMKLPDYRYALEEIYNKCRSQLKHGESLGEKAEDLLEEIKGLASVVIE